MTFTEPWLLWALLASGLPVLLHLVNRWRHRSVPWPSLRFLFQATHDSSGRQRLRDFLQLFLRVFCILFLVLAMSKPVSSPILGLRSSGVQRIILLLDRSASMDHRPDGLHSHRDTVIPILTQALLACPNTQVFVLDSVERDMRPVPTPEEWLKHALPSTTDTQADWPDLMARTAQFIQNSPAGKTEIWIVSDMQEPDWQPHSPRWQQVRSALLAMSVAPSLRVLSLRNRHSVNRAIRIHRAEPRPQALEIEFSIEQSSPSNNLSPETCKLEVDINGNTRSISVDFPGVTTRFIRHIPLPPDTHRGYGSIRLPDDSLLRDNVAYFVFAPLPVAHVLIRAEQQELEQTLSNMAAPPGLPRDTFRADCRHVQAGALFLDDVSLVVWQGALPVGQQFSDLMTFLKRGGQALFLPSMEPHEATLSSPPPSLQAYSNQQEHAAEGTWFNLQSWNHQEGPLKDAQNNIPIPVDQIRAIIRVPFLGAGTAYAQWQDDKPALLFRAFGHGGAWYLNTLPVYSWSNLADGHLMIPLLNRLILQGSQRLSVPSSFEAGKPVDALSLLPGTPVIRVDSDTSHSSSPLSSAGVYRQRNRLFCANVPVGESSPVQLSDTTLQQLFRELPMTPLHVESSRETAVFNWQTPFLIFSILCFLAEAFLQLSAYPQTFLQGQQQLRES